MAIEVRQLLITSTVRQHIGSETEEKSSRLDLEAFKEELLAECRRLFTEMLRENQER